MADYIPRERAARFQWLGTFRTDLASNAVALGFTPADVIATDDLWMPYSDAFNALPPTENAYNAAVTVLNEEEETFIAHVRGMVAEIQTNPDVTDAQRTAAGLPIRKTTRTAAAVPTTRPVAEVDTSQRLQHTVSFRNEGATDRAKPEGVRGCEIWCVIGPAPASVADARYLATDTASPYLATFDAADAGKTVHYFLRWVNTRSEAGPWSETVAATIGG